MLKVPGCPPSLAAALSTTPEYMLAKYVSEDQFKLYITLCSNIVCFFYAVAVLMLSLG